MYPKGKYQPRIFKEYKTPLFGTGGENHLIYIFSNSLEYMGSLQGHTGGIGCLAAISTQNQLWMASGSCDKSIKIWDIYMKNIIYSFSLSPTFPSALCWITPQLLVSGSFDGSILIWNLGSLKNRTNILVSPPQILSGHKSEIQEIIKLNNTQIISVEHKGGNMIIWNIVEGTCVRHITIKEFPHNELWSLRKFNIINGELIASCFLRRIIIWNINNWETPKSVFKFNKKLIGATSIQCLSADIFLRGKDDGELEILDLRSGDKVEEVIPLHTEVIMDIQKIAKNILVTVSEDDHMKVTDVLDRKCYYDFHESVDPIYCIAKFY